MVPISFVEATRWEKVPPDISFVDVERLMSEEATGDDFKLEVGLSLRRPK